ncbi:hypothetical protein EXN66_Car021428 [Channa argus]|uniref:Uncharacterized protein n=1 Tax=Channa argus TaxID=215402 RepID=A0A6G1QTC8_CHAAH|nr:hypothetical protein EXN66_Car021428 [Channa argus]
MKASGNTQLHSLFNLAGSKTEVSTKIKGQLMQAKEKLRPEPGSQKRMHFLLYRPEANGKE